MTVTLSASASGGFTAGPHTAACVVTNTAATNFTLTPSSQTTEVGVATGNYIVTLNGTLSSNETIALSDGGAGGTFTPSSLTFTSGNAGTPQTFTYTPASGQAGNTETLTATGTGQFSASHSASCAVTAGLTAGTAYATYVGAKTVQLSATQATGGSGTYTFQWYRSTSSGSHGTALSGATAESYIDATASPGTGYYYSLAYNDGTNTVYSAQIGVTTLAGTAYEIVGGIGDSIEAGSYSTIETPFSAMIDQLNFGMPSREWYGGTNTSGISGGLSLSLDLAVSGTKTTDWLPAGTLLPGAVATLSAAGVTRIVTNLGANDAAVGTALSPTTYRSNYAAIITYLFANIATLKSVHLVGPMFQGEASGEYSVQNAGLLIQYDGKMTSLANGSTIFHVNPLGPYNYMQRRGAIIQRSADLLHPNDYGDQAVGGLWAFEVMQALSPVASASPAGYSRARIANA
jgi:hypothetical protein